MEPSHDLRVNDYAHDSGHENHSGICLSQVSPLYESPKALAPLSRILHKQTQKQSHVYRQPDAPDVRME